MRRFLTASIAVFSSMILFGVSESPRAHAAVPLRTILLSTNDLNDLGLAPAEGEILYDMVSGGISVRLNGNDLILPQSARVQRSETGARAQGLEFNPDAVIPRTVLLPIGNISSPVEGELGYDTQNSRVVIYRGGSWLALGNRAGVARPSFADRLPPGALYRHVLPNVTTVSPVDGELVADFVNNTVLFMTGGTLKDLRSPMLRNDKLSYYFGLVNE